MYTQHWHKKNSHALTCSLLLQQTIANPTSLNKDIPTSQKVKCAISAPLVVTNCRFPYTSLPMIGQKSGSIPKCHWFSQCVYVGLVGKIKEGIHSWQDRLLIKLGCVYELETQNYIFNCSYMTRQNIERKALKRSKDFRMTQNCQSGFLLTNKQESWCRKLVVHWYIAKAYILTNILHFHHQPRSCSVWPIRVRTSFYFDSAKKYSMWLQM